MILVLDGDEAERYLRYLAGSSRTETLLRPQTSGPCVHYGPYGCEVPREDGQCPHLDNASIVCPIKDVLGAAQAYAPAEPEFVELEPDEDHAYAIQLPTPAKRKNAWTEDENWTVARADTRAEAIEAYRAAYPDSTRTDKAILSRWEKLHTECRAPLTPDFAGDTVPVTQCDEAAIRRPRFKTGDRVRISHPAFKGYTGTIRRYYAATENYLTHIDGTTDTTWLSEEYLEAA